MHSFNIATRDRITGERLGRVVQAVCVSGVVGRRFGGLADLVPVRAGGDCVVYHV
jgi:hypothetical protein